VARGWVHTVHRGGVWFNEIEGAEPFSSHANREEAVAAGRAQARASQTEHVVHHVDGTIAERNSYGHDPFPPRG
jgi:Uncharacterized protein conserved in bacteria (DUF2188)